MTKRAIQLFKFKSLLFVEVELMETEVLIDIRVFLLRSLLFVEVELMETPGQTLASFLLTP